MDKTNGNLSVCGNLIDKNMSKQEFVKTFKEELRSDDLIKKNFRFKKPCTIDGLNFWINVLFSDEKISVITLNNADERLVNSYDEWSNYKQKKKKESHDQWLTKELGEPIEKKAMSLIFKRDWGEATSYEDPKSGDVKIWISYR